MTEGEGKPLGERLAAEVVDHWMDLPAEQREQIEGRVTSTVASVATGLAEIGRQLAQWIEPWRDSLAAFAEWTVANREAIAVWAEAVAGLPLRVQRALITLAEKGWYFDPRLGLSDLVKWANDFDSGDAAAAEAALVEHFEASLDEIEKEIVLAEPARERVIKAALRAHRRGEYELSVPVLLAQVDGICKARTGGHLFMRDRSAPKNARPETAAWVESQAAKGAFTLWYVPLVHPLPLSESEKARSHRAAAADPSGGVELNRHAVLHGETTEYGTQVNSLKVIALLHYLTQVFEEGV